MKGFSGRWTGLMYIKLRKIPETETLVQKNPPPVLAGELLARSYIVQYNDYFLVESTAGAAAESTLTVESVAGVAAAAAAAAESAAAFRAALSTVVSVFSASLLQATMNVAIARIANTFFIVLFCFRF